MQAPASGPASMVMSLMIPFLNLFRARSILSSVALVPVEALIASQCSHSPQDLRVAGSSGLAVSWHNAALISPKVGCISICTISLRHPCSYPAGSLRGGGYPAFFVQDLFKIVQNLIFRAKPSPSLFYSSSSSYFGSSSGSPSGSGWDVPCQAEPGGMGLVCNSMVLDSSRSPKTSRKREGFTSVPFSSGSA